VAKGEAFTEFPVLALRLEAGDHTYVLPPVAVSWVFAPLQIVTSFPAETMGNGFTTTVTDAVSVQPEAFVTVTT
jgi:hypothetical protein